MLGSLLFIVVTVWIGLSALLYWMQPRFIYFPSRELVLTPDAAGMPYEEVRITTADGVGLHGWLVAGDGDRGTVLFFHGNAGNISHRLDSIAIFRDLGLSVLIIDYRGYGRSDGRPGERGTYRDAVAAWRFLVEERGVAAHRIIVFGRSLGAAVAAWLGTQVEPAGVVLESAFTSVADMGRRHYPYLPVAWLVRIHYPTLDHVPLINAPVLIAHSREDELVPHEMGRRLFAAAREPKSFLEMRGGHNDGFLVSGSDYREGLSRFATRVLAPPEAP